MHLVHDLLAHVFGRCGVSRALEQERSRYVDRDTRADGADQLPAPFRSTRRPLNVRTYSNYLRDNGADNERRD
jgi:hypothetical protein